MSDGNAPQQLGHFGIHGNAKKHSLNLGVGLVSEQSTASVPQPAPDL